MVNPLTSCCCGCSLRTGVKILAVLDIIAGVMTILSLTSIQTNRVETYEHFHYSHDGVEYSSNVPLDLPMLERVMRILTCIGNTAALVLFASAIMALRGISKGNSRLLKSDRGGNRITEYRRQRPSLPVLSRRSPATSPPVPRVNSVPKPILNSIILPPETCRDHGSLSAVPLPQPSTPVEDVRYTSLRRISYLSIMNGESERGYVFRSKLVRQYAIIRALDVVLSVAMCLWILIILPRLAREFMDAVIEQMREEAKERHEDPPDIDEEAIIKIIVGLGTTILVVTEAFGVLLKLYFVWAIKSCAYWMERGVDPYAPIYVVSQPAPAQPVGATYNAYQPANVILGPPVAAPASDQPTASLLVSEGPQNPTAPVLPGGQTAEGDNQGRNMAESNQNRMSQLQELPLVWYEALPSPLGPHNQATSGDAYPRI